jgi:protein-S-isoprenylcysteine O-methyltransferase Ste14
MGVGQYSRQEFLPVSPFRSVFLSAFSTIMFDPFGWAARLAPEKWLHRLIRAGAIAVFCFFLLRRIEEYGNFLLKPLWVVETVIYLVLIAAFLLRVDPLDRARGVREILVPLAGGILPFGLLISPPYVANRAVLYAVFWWMTVATALTVWGMWTLRRSFSITVEARQLVTGGPYRWIRHPVYAGELLTAAAVAAWRFSALNVTLLLLFAAIQLLRSRWEERKLGRVFPAYATWAKTAWWFWPIRSEA